jgi:hypothetical protein
VASDPRPCLESPWSKFSPSELNSSKQEIDGKHKWRGIRNYGQTTHSEFLVLKAFETIAC